ncbi:MAG: hypothetical protein HKN23_04875, partial [Verrucomicrobiales bacterium]|nr:hypothetical protein [Verrucomicrobiales bacterium]
MIRFLLVGVFAFFSSGDFLFSQDKKGKGPDPKKLKEFEEKVKKMNEERLGLMTKSYKVPPTFLNVAPAPVDP